MNSRKFILSFIIALAVSTASTATIMQQSVVLPHANLSVSVNGSE